MRVIDLPQGIAPWPRTAFPAELPEMTTRLRSRVLDRLDASGAIRDPCHSRVLESALACRLVARLGIEPLFKSGLERYLSVSRPDPMDSLLASAALGRHQSRTTEKLTTSFLEQVPDFTSTRKRVMIDAILALFGTTPGANLDLAAFNTTGLHPWAAVQVTALKLIILDALGRRHLIRDTDSALLLSTQNEPWIWEGNILIHLSVLHALAPSAGMGLVVAEGVKKLLPHQRADGGMPFVTDTDTWSTATAGVALHASGASRDQLRPLTSYLLSRQQPNGGWSVNDRASLTDVDDTSVALEFLYAVGVQQPVLDQGLTALRGVRGPDGGFPTYVAGSPSEACMTAAAINALTIQAPQHHDLIIESLEFLAIRQHAGGGFDPDWSASRLHTLFRVVLAGQALRDTGTQPARRMLRHALRAVLDSQNADGGWGQQPGEPSDALSTSYALIALTRQTDHRPALRGLEFLLDKQRPNGRIETIPDSIGPRPFIFTIPVLADVFALLAHGHLAHRMERTH
ncbi:prenyltransferase/squalene oxidase repeat-containing protein [Kribbella sp. NPDC056861]|uniref:prenyltransferase/squalene oxidase repeat-containing protein n=1 Tax=Kribbella sp. NPDC056861 TaxID=3154857 RepID=UPI003413A8F4